MVHSYSVHDGFLEVSSIQQGDIERLRTLRNLDAIRFSFIDSRVISPEEQKMWFERYKEKDDDFMFAIRLAQTTVGFFALYGYDRDRETVEFGRFMIDPKHQGKGSGRRAIALALLIAFGKLKVSEVTLEVFGENTTAVKLYDSAGFKVVSGKGDLVKMAYRAIGNRAE